MSLPGNGIFVVKGEISVILTAMRRGNRWSSHHSDDELDPLIKPFQDLKDVLNSIEDLRRIDPVDYLKPFLKVIRSEDTSGPITSLALSAVNKFLTYGLLDATHASVPLTVHNVADAVTHARFVGTDQSSDGVVLMKILQVLKTLTLSVEGAALTNESLCDIMLSCFRICFETRLNELLRRTAEYYLRDMIQLVFVRLPQFPEVFTGNFKLLKMRPGNIEQTRLRKRSKGGTKLKKNAENDEHKTSPSSENIVDMQGSISQLSTAHEDKAVATTDADCATHIDVEHMDEEPASPPAAKAESDAKEEFVNQRGITFTNQHPEDMMLIPYGLACVYELFRFLISLCNPMDKQNNDVMIHLGLTLLTTAFEVGADSIGKYSSLLALVKDDLCRNLFALLATDRLSLFTATLQVSFLMFEALRTHVKFQLEHYLMRLMEIIVSESPKVTYEHKEIALDNILQLWRIPGLTTELYLNYDCDMYCSNLFEDLTQLLAKNACSMTRGVYHTHLLSLDALLTVVDSIAKRCREQRMEEIDKSTTVCSKIIESRPKMSENVPSREDLLAVKNIKKWLPTGTEYFNQKPKKGIQFLQEQGVLSTQLDPHEICVFLRENPGLDKKMIGEYISGRANLRILQEFVQMFDFTDLRIDEALRLYLETFRLPGEAPLISLLMEHFAEHWHKCNGEPFANADAAFTLAYAVIMLNVDQHNQNVKRQNNPMTADGFKKNLTKVNGGSDFAQDMLDEIYAAIRSEEIVMPAEQTGIVRENYEWKVLLRRGASKDGRYVHVAGGVFDRDLFALLNAPIVGALSSVFDKAEEASVYRHAISGYERCALISAHYALHEHVDVLIATLAKYTLLEGQPRSSDLMIQLGASAKAQLALKTIFQLAHQHGQCVWKGWWNLFDLILTLYVHGMLPKCFIEAEDFIEKSGRIALVYKPMAVPSQKQDSGLLSSLYSYVGFSDNIAKVSSQEESACVQRAKECIAECNLEALITDSKFLHADTLQNLVHWLTEWSRGPDVEKSLGYNYNENVTVFFLELLVKIVLLNRDRVLSIWQSVRVHLYTLVMNAAQFDYQFLLERSVIGLLRLAIRLMRNEEMSPIVLQSMRMLLLLKSSTLHRISRQISFGLYELLKTSAQNIHTSTDWSIIFTLLECVGAGAQPPKPITSESQVAKGARSESEMQMTEEEAAAPDRGYASDSDVNKTPVHAGRSQSPIIVPVSPIGSPHNNSGGWILVGNEGEIQPVVGRTPPAHEYSLSLERNFGMHDPQGLVKCCESLAFLVRDVAHITPYNFDNCVHCIRTFVEASLHCSKRIDSRCRQKNARRSVSRGAHRSPVASPDEEESDEEVLPGAYHQVAIQVSSRKEVAAKALLMSRLQLLDLMHTLHTRTAQIFKWWAEESGQLANHISLWTQGWCPLLQGIARLCCDPRKEVRTHAITYLQRALLVHDLQTLSGPEWAACFNRVLFPMLNQLLQPVVNANELAPMEETRMRAATVLSKVFLHHLTPLLSLDTFPPLWLTILEYMDRYMHADKSDLLAEAIPESLKNMLLVMESAGVFANSSTLWKLTWDRINKFLPDLKHELFNEKGSESEQKPSKDEDVEQQAHQNLENVSRTSIILQPPQPTSSVVTSPLFAHLGHMVSTSIGPPSPLSDEVASKEQSTLPDQSPMHNSKPPEKTPRSKNIPPPTTQSMHAFPILYAPTGIQTSSGDLPVTLYTEYTNDPYNFPDNSTFRNYSQHDSNLPGSPLHNNNSPAHNVPSDLKTLTNLPSPDNQRSVFHAKNGCNVADGDVEQASDEQLFDQIFKENGNTVFQSSNYFANNDFDIPPGSEMLFMSKLPLNGSPEPLLNGTIASPQPIGSQFEM